MNRAIWLAGVWLTSAVSAASAEGQESTNPRCAFTEIDATYAHRPFQNPEERGDTTLTVQYTDPNSTTIAGCPVTLRTYDGLLVGPTLRVKRGETLSLSLVNDLPIESPEERRAQFLQQDSVAVVDVMPNGHQSLSRA